METQDLIDNLAAEIAGLIQVKDRSFSVPVGVSNRHIHLNRDDLDVLFGKGFELTVKSELKQPGQYAAAETVSIAGPKGSINQVRVLGPLRASSQVEISRSDAFTLGIKPPVRNSGDLDGSAGLCVIGPKGMLVMNESVICARRHIHMSIDEARRFGLADGDIVNVETASSKKTTFHGVLIRSDSKSALEFHIDTDEANAAELNNGDLVRISAKRG
ncbi:phosphate propanoyltransferase [Paenibacillus sp. BR2-3]|uniref:phosphate propanoyltransferase n=1 Tax=Paenibacillus sp. BR2-3 TaxID=3048494 RepID=UPI003977D6A5